MHIHFSRSQQKDTLSGAVTGGSAVFCVVYVWAESVSWGYLCTAPCMRKCMWLLTISSKR